MNVIFLTHNVEQYSKLFNKATHISVQHIENTAHVIHEITDGWKRVGFDIEASDLNHLRASPLLFSISVEDKDAPVIVIDVTNTEQVMAHVVKPVQNLFNSAISLGANIKYDGKVVEHNYGLRIGKVRDVIVQEQRLTQNMGYRYGLDAILERYFPEVPPLNKAIRSQFIKANPKTFVFTAEQIDYAAGDTIYLFMLDDRQRELLTKRGTLDFVDRVENPLSNVLKDIELEGFRFAKKEWLDLSWKNTIKLWEIECRLDESMWSLRDKLPHNRKMYLSGGMYSRKRPRPQQLSMEGLFGFDVSFEAVTGHKKPVNTKANINYGSTDQVVYIFSILGEPLPTQDGRYDVIPIVDVEHDAKGQPRIVVSNKGEQFSTSADSLEQMLIRFPDHKCKDFLKELIEYRNLANRISSFGKAFVDKYYEEDEEKVFTVYRQCSEDSGLNIDDGQSRSPVNGRLSSGNVKSRYYNAQNLPRDKEFRKCFIAGEGYSITTRDLSGAEVTIMADKANDSRLLELHGKDIHSHMATKAWRNIYLYRAGLDLFYTFQGGVYPLWTDGKSFMAARHDKVLLDVIRKSNNPFVMMNYRLSQEFVISKEVNADKRQPAKNLTFGTVYGCKPKKAAITINVSEDEGYIYIETLKGEIPDTFKYVESNVTLALKQGYLEIDPVSKTRVWFPEVVNLIRTNRRLYENNQLLPENARLPYMKADYEIIKSVDGQARNIPISGTQANMIKHMMVNLSYFIIEKSTDAQIVGQVHDELLVRHRNELPKYDYKGTPMEFTDVIKYIMEDTANLYLTNFKMSSEGFTLPYWTK